MTTEDKLLATNERLMTEKLTLQQGHTDLLERLARLSRYTETLEDRIARTLNCDLTGAAVKQCLTVSAPTYETDLPSV